MSASEKTLYKDNGWFVGVTPRRNPEIVVACLFEGGEHGALAAQVATKVIKAYVEKQRNKQTQVAKAATTNKAEVAAVWHEGDAQSGENKLQGGRFTVPLDANKQLQTKSARATTVNRRADSSTMQVVESHTEMANPEVDASQAQPTEPPLRPSSSQDPTVSRYVSFRDFDWVLLALVLLICALGVVEIYSATLNTKFMGVHIKQVYWVMGGVALMFAMSLISYQAL